MRARRSAHAALALLLLAGCVSSSDGDRDRDRDRGADQSRAQAEERARSYCKAAAQARGLRVDRVGEPEKVGKHRYELKVRILPLKTIEPGDKPRKRVLCRYDDKNRLAQIE